MGVARYIPLARRLGTIAAAAASYRGAKLETVHDKYLISNHSESPFATPKCEMLSSWRMTSNAGIPGYSLSKQIHNPLPDTRCPSLCYSRLLQRSTKSYLLLHLRRYVTRGFGSSICRYLRPHEGHRSH